MKIYHQELKYRLCQDQAQDPIVLQLLDHITKENVNTLATFLRAHPDDAARLVTQPLRFVRRNERVEDYDSCAISFNCTAFEYAYWAGNEALMRICLQHMQPDDRMQAFERLMADDFSVGTSRNLGGDLGGHFDYSTCVSFLESADKAVNNLIHVQKELQSAGIPLLHKVPEEQRPNPRQNRWRRGAERNGDVKEIKALEALNDILESIQQEIAAVAPESLRTSSAAKPFIEHSILAPSQGVRYWKLDVGNIPHAIYELRTEVEMHQRPAEAARRSVFKALEKEAQSLGIEVGYRPGNIP